MLRKSLLIVLSFVLCLISIHGEEFPDSFLENYCFDCHDDLTQKAEIRLDDAIDRDWSDPDSLHFFERVKKVIENGEMPPAKQQNQPSASERKAVTDWLHSELMTHSKVGGTVLRRLNRTEYENTIRKLFFISDFKLPDGFPPDQSFHGFDNIGEGLILSPPLLEAYQKAAVSVADAYFPPPKTAVPSTTFVVKPDEMVISYSSGQIVDGAMRLASKSSPVMRSCSWPSKFEARGSGKYQIDITLSAPGHSEDQPAIFQLLAKKVSDSDGIAVESLRQLTEIEITSAKPQSWQREVEIYEGETVVFYWANAPLDSDNNDKVQFETYLRKRFEQDPRLMAAWMAIEHNSGIRGGIGWERVKEKLASEGLDLSNARVDSEDGEKLIKVMLKNPVLYVETISYDLFENGPNVGVHELKITGPTEKVEDDRDRLVKKRQDAFLAPGTGLSGDAKVVAIMNRFLTRCFRRPAVEDQVLPYVDLIMECAKDPNLTIEEGYHLAIRSALCSPEFLYRETRPGRLDNFDLASRLSYFFTSAPDHSNFTKPALNGRLTEIDTLERAVRKTLQSSACQMFIENFVGQWLGTRELGDIMPDPRLLNFNTTDERAMKDEAEMLFAEILRKNLPIDTFIQPGFTYLNQPLANKYYGLKKIKGRGMQKVDLPEDSPFGGILGMAAVMMATANGVDTEPVNRGVWVLENVLGDPPPPPPQNVPAITPDTRGAKTIRDLLNAHRADQSCARCHNKIDPIGYVLENFDPVGRWRTHYPIYDEKGKAKDGILIDPSGKLPGSEVEFSHVNDLKDYVVENIDQFAFCLGEKILMVATGRELSYADRDELRKIVVRTVDKELGFQDFMVELIKSEVFLTK